MFKFECNKEKYYYLKIMSAQFSGSFSEYFIHDLLLDFKKNNRIDAETPKDFRKLLQEVKNTGSEHDIILNYVAEKSKPDLDIFIKPKTAILLKNATVDSDNVSKIWSEFELCKKKNISQVWLGFNFVKNFDKFDYISQTIDNLKAHHKNIQIEIFDIKDLVTHLLHDLKRQGKSKLNFSELDIYRLIDY